MLSPSQFRDLVSGSRRGARASLLRMGLRLAEVPYAAAMRLRNRLYDWGLFAARRPGVPVISVGNLTLGGTGKTPLVEWIARRLSGLGLRVAVISRGYGSRGGRPNDEALQLARKLPGVLHLENPDRVSAARRAIDQSQCQVILLDDAFQHRRIARDLDIVLLDALEPFGFEHVFPRGSLREPLAGLGRAGVVVLSRADMLSAADRADIRRRAQRLAPQATWVEARHAPRRLVSANGEERPLEAIHGCPVAAFCGIGNPAGFRHTLQQCDCQVVAFREFPDHHAYSRADLDELKHWAQGLDVAAVLCTEKDMVKIGASWPENQALWAIRVELEFLAGQSELENLLSHVLTHPTAGGEDPLGRSP